MAGAALLFFYGPPQPDLQEGISLNISGPEVGRHNAQVRRLRARHKRLSRLALILIFAGFTFMLVGTWA
jgi:hypothetical protein